MPARRPAPAPSRRPAKWLFRIALLAAVVLPAQLAAPVQAQEITTRADLIRALSRARGGETLILADGAYGDLAIGGAAYASVVTVRARNPAGARFGTVALTGGTRNIALDGVQLDGELSISDASAITVRRSVLRAFNAVTDARDITFVGNDIGGSLHGLFIEDTRGFVVANNRFHRIGSDHLRVVGNSSGGLIEGNAMLDMVPVRFSDGSTLHSDAIQMFGRNGFNPHGITIRGNLIWDDPQTGDAGLWGQGIFLADPQGRGYRDLLIERNLITVGTPNSIFVALGTENVVIRDNTLIPWPDGGAVIRLAGENPGVVVVGNIAAGILDETATARIGDNLVYGGLVHAGKPLTWPIFAGDGRARDDYRLRPDLAELGAVYGAHAPPR